MRRVIVFLLCIILCGCTASEDLSSELDAVFSSEQSNERIRRNNYSHYVDYYLPSDTGELEGNELSSCFSYNSSNFVMDVNISGIINDRYYPEAGLTNEDFFDKSKLVYERRSAYVDAEGQSRDFLYRVYSYEDHYLSYFASKDLLFYGYGTRSDIVAVSSRILLMAKGAIVRENDVIAAYSKRNEVDYEKKQVNLFETIMPVNGNVNDLVIGKEDTGASE